MRKPNALHVIAATVLLTGTASNDETRLDHSGRTMLNIRIAAAVLECYRDLHGTLPELGPKLVTASRVADELGPDLAKALSARDGWGNPIQFALFDDGYTLVSFGADGEEDAPYDDQLRSVGIARSEAGSGAAPADRDIIFQDGKFVQAPDPPAKRVISEIRTIAAAIESYAVDTGDYPGPIKDHLWDVGALAVDLEPLYVPTLPRVDPWGRPYLVWSDCQNYLIVSTGADGVLDRDYLASDIPAAARSEWSFDSPDNSDDIVVANGKPVGPTKIVIVH